MQQFDDDLRSELPLYTGEKITFTTSLLNNLSDDQLNLLNVSLPWAAYTVDNLGRRFGNITNSKKRHNAQPILDYRAALLNERFSLN